MGKRSDFERAPRDFYPTPAEAVAPLLMHLGRNEVYAEPCAGDGALIDHLTAAGHRCAWACDIEPQRHDIHENDATTCGKGAAEVYITNPPWLRSTLHDIIINLSDQAPTWLLFDADWIHTRQAAPFLPRLRKVVSVGRVKWIADSKFTGKDNCAWHLFTAPSAELCSFHGRGFDKPRPSTDTGGEQKQGFSLIPSSIKTAAAPQEVRPAGSEPSRSGGSE